MTGFVNDEASIFIPSIFDEYGGYDVTYYKTLLDDIGSGFLHKEKVKSFLICHYPPARNDTKENVKTYMQVRIFKDKKHIMEKHSDVIWVQVYAS